MIKTLGLGEFLQVIGQVLGKHYLSPWVHLSHYLCFYCLLSILSKMDKV